MISFSSLYISNFPKFDTIIMHKLKNYLRLYLNQPYFSFLYNSNWHQQNKKIHYTNEDPSMYVKEMQKQDKPTQRALNLIVSLQTEY